MGGGFGGQGLTPCDPNSAANDARSMKPADDRGVNIHSKEDHRIEVNHRVQHTEGPCWLEVKGGKGETKLGGFLELVVGMKHSIIALFKTAIDISYSKTFNIGPYSTEMFAAKYEILASKKEKVYGKKRDDYKGAKWEKSKGKWTEYNTGKRREEQALEKEITDRMAEKVGPLLEATAARFKARANAVQQKIGSLDMKIHSELRVKCAEARMSVAEFDRHLSNIDYHCGKFQRKCDAMDEAVGSVLEIKGSKKSTKAAAMKVKASLLKFTAPMIKLGE